MNISYFELMHQLLKTTLLTHATRSSSWDPIKNAQLAVAHTVRHLLSEWKSCTSYAVTKDIEDLMNKIRAELTPVNYSEQDLEKPGQGPALDLPMACVYLEAAMYRIQFVGRTIVKDSRLDEPECDHCDVNDDGTHN